MSALNLPVIAAWSVASVFALSALAQLAGFRFVRAAYARWEFPRHFHRIAGFVNLLAAVFLALPQTRVWGVAIAGIVLFITVVTLLKNRHYAYALPGIVMMVALPPALLASAV